MLEMGIGMGLEPHGPVVVVVLEYKEEGETDKEEEQTNHSWGDG